MVAIESSPFEDAMLAAPPPKRIEAESKGLAEPPRDDVVVPITPRKDEERRGHSRPRITNPQSGSGSRTNTFGRAPFVSLQR